MDDTVVKSEPATALARKKETYDCHVCKKKFSSQKKLEGHVKKAHPGVKPYRCLICDTSLTRMTSYKEHMNIHTGEKPHKCNVCNEAFATGKSLYRHQEKHETIADRKCLNCQTKFETWDDFNNHTKSCVRIVPSNARINDLVHSCNVCGLRFQRIGTLNEHMNTHTGNKPFACRWCKERFPNTKQLRRHILNHDRKNPKCCSRCQKLFNNWPEFKKHIDEEVCKYSANTCIVCKEKFTRQEDMETHYRINHPTAEKLYGCDEIGCEKRFCHRQLLLIHKRLHAKKKAKADPDRPKTGYDCPVCKTRIQNYKNLIDHVKTHLNDHNDGIKEDVEDAPLAPLVTPKYEENYSDDSNDFFDTGFRDIPSPPSPDVKTEPTDAAAAPAPTNDVKVKLEDISLNTVEPILSIEELTKDTKRRPRVKDGERKKTGPKSVHPSKAPDFQCTICGKMLMNKKNLLVHFDSHSEEPRYECHYCGIRLKHHNSMIRHVRNHIRPKPHGCDVPDCEEKFSNINEAKIHQKKHRIETGRTLIHTCSICGKSYSEKKILTQHYKIHGDDQFQCDQCPAVFKIIARLRKHMMLHTGAKPFGCSACGKFFRTKYSLQRHLERCKARNLGVVEKKFFCNICGKGMSSKSSLTVHQRIHTGQLPFGCDWPFCNMMFNNKVTLQKHRSVHHPNQFVP